MDFALDADQRDWQAKARAFADAELAPRYQQRERDGRIEPEIIARMGELGFIAPELPSRYGGRDAPRLLSGLITEQISRGDFNVAYVQVVASLVGQVIARNGTDAVKDEWLPRMIAGTSIVGIGLSEPHGGSDAGNPHLSARRERGGWVLNGTKSMSFNRVADGVIVFAKTDPHERKRGRGISAFFVPFAAEGVTRDPVGDLGTIAVGRGFVHFADTWIPEENLLGDEGKGFTQVMQGFDFSRALIALQCLAVAEVTVEETWEYTSRRDAFDKPLSTYQGVAFPLAEAMTKIEAAKQLSYKTLWLKDNDLPHTSEAAMVKWWAPRVSVETLHECLLLHGQYGYKTDRPIGQRLRDVMGLEIGDGTAQIMKLIIARQAVGREFAP
ncbi:acyl-CoA dehydrogenase family protein [Microbacterium sp. ASV49]|uniref:Acyl-CoA dehydrogenase family protein n=1 Tax=Microbacterium candidum TaxID=3041922 RepID=A0ABT7MW74_9MICO|nr:acyl-CoA dehydrogenase family protein [Microbacterium sp. ASV49]MDL9978675.1 acyl-CoA dehydrogenase family protein [Microbacterium sp. ASV49]